MATRPTENIIGILTERPTSFTIGSRRFCLYPASLGKMQLISALTANLGFDAENAKRNADVEWVRVVSEHSEECMRVVAYSVLPGKECLDEGKVENVIKFFVSKMKPADLPVLMSAIMADSGVNNVLHYYGIDKDGEEYRRIAEMKESSGSYVYGGKSMWGTIISPLAEKYGWTMDYIVWGISYANIQMLLADAPKTVFLSEKERKRIRPRNRQNVIKADDARNMEILKRMKFM